jgi:hypothetical protein
MTDFVTFSSYLLCIGTRLAQSVNALDAVIKFCERPGLTTLPPCPDWLWAGYWWGGSCLELKGGGV